MTEESRTQIVRQLEVILREVFQMPELIVSEALTMDQVPAWDSIGHMSVIGSVEKYYGFRCSLSDLVEVTDVGRLVNLVLDKTGR